jgi:hypothetical protein
MFLPAYTTQGRTFEHITEPYVSSPPAAYVILDGGVTFSLGQKMKEVDKLKGRYLFNVLVDSVELGTCDTGEYASFIEKKDRRVRILTRTGWKVWSERGRCFL